MGTTARSKNTQNEVQENEGLSLSTCTSFFFIPFIYGEKSWRGKKYIIYFIVHILIVFENTIRKTETKRILAPPPVLFSCCHVVTLSRFAITNWKCAYCARDNSVTTKSMAKFIVTHLSNYISACLLHGDNVTT